MHLFAGIWGTLTMTLAPDGSWGDGVTREQQFVNEFTGVAAVALYAFLRATCCYELSTACNQFG